MDPTKELPLGFGMALAQNQQAMQRFASLSEPQQQQVLAQAETVQSKAEMHAIVSGITQM